MKACCGLKKSFIRQVSVYLENNHFGHKLYMFLRYIKHKQKFVQIHFYTQQCKISIIKDEWGFLNASYTQSLYAKFQHWANLPADLQIAKNRNVKWKLNLNGHKLSFPVKTEHTHSIHKRDKHLFFWKQSNQQKM